MKSDNKAQLILWSLVIICGIVAFTMMKAPKPTQQQPAIYSAPFTPEWMYYDELDAMTSKRSYFAALRSTNKFSLSFPYDGEQRASITLRTSPKYGKDIILEMDKGQFLCYTRGCSVLVKFGDKQPQRFSAAEPETRESNVLFLNGYGQFVANMMKADKVIIEVPIYKEGNRQLVFDTKGFDANRYLGKNPQPTAAPAKM